MSESGRRIFVSYAEKNDGDEVRLCVEALRSTLKQERIQFFISSEGIEAGDDWETRLREELNQADLVMCFLSEQYFESAWCREESELAMQRNRNDGMPVLPVRLRPYNTREHSPLKQIQAIPNPALILRNDLELEEAYEKISASLVRLLNECERDTLKPSSGPGMGAAAWTAAVLTGLAVLVWTTAPWWSDLLTFSMQAESVSVERPRIEVSLSTRNENLFVQVANVSPRHVDIQQITLFGKYVEIENGELSVKKGPPMKQPSEQMRQAMGDARKLFAQPIRAGRELADRKELHRFTNRMSLYPASHAESVQTFVVMLQFPEDGADDAPGTGRQYQFWFEFEFKVAGQAQPLMITSEPVTRGVLYQDIQ